MRDKMWQRPKFLWTGSQSHPTLTIMLEKKTSLRLLYTINSSPQYILARSHTTVPVTLLPPEGVTNGDNAQPIYGSVLLKTCLNTICRSSPELIQDHARDFSLYVLDPLESNSTPAPVRISNTNREPSSTKPTSSPEQPRGVAVGLGLMSWALSSDDSDPVTVVGTIVKQGTGQEALEVIFALREVCLLGKFSRRVESIFSTTDGCNKTTGMDRFINISATCECEERYAQVSLNSCRMFWWDITLNAHWSVFFIATFFATGTVFFPVTSWRSSACLSGSPLMHSQHYTRNPCVNLFKNESEDKAS